MGGCALHQFNWEMWMRVDLTGQRFNRLTAIRFVGRRGTNPYWVFRCDCGVEKEMQPGAVKSGVVKSCGCLNRELTGARRRTHGQYQHPLMKVYTAAKQRCENPNDKAYHNYGGRGVRMADEWQEFQPFFEWAMANGYKSGLQLDRVDNDGDYAPDNCRFVTRAANNRNKRTNVLTEDDVAEMRRKASEGMRYSDIAAEFNYDQSATRKICLGLIWR
jgi:hypothetical protein